MAAVNKSGGSTNTASVSGGVAAGIPGGIPGDPLRAPSSATPPASPRVFVPPPAGSYGIGNGVSPPTIVSKVEPEYSELARTARREGEVVLQTVVDENGLPQNIHVIRSLGFGLDEKAIEAVQKWRFKPAIKNGKPVALLSTIEVNFPLLKPPSPPPLRLSSSAPSRRSPARIGLFQAMGCRRCRLRWGIPGEWRRIAREISMRPTMEVRRFRGRVDTEGRSHMLAGPNSPFHLTNPFGITVDSSGTVYFTENSGRIRKLLPNGDAAVIAGGDKLGFSPDGAPAVGSPISNTHSVAIALDGSVVFSELGNNRIRRVDAQGRLQTIVATASQFSGDGGPAVSASLSHPSGIAYSSQGDLFIADQSNRRIRKVTPDGKISTILGKASRRTCPSVRPASR